MAESRLVDEADWTGWDTSKRQELPRFKHAFPHQTSMESGKVFLKHESLDSPLAVPDPSDKRDRLKAGLQQSSLHHNPCSSSPSVVGSIFIRRWARISADY